MGFLLQGWLLGIAYVAPIGMQNMYLINTAIEKDRLRALQVALIIIFFDVTLAFACYWGIGKVMEHFTILQLLVTGVGSLAVIWIGIGLIRATPGQDQKENFDKSLLQVVGTCFVVTWLNPQALIDGTLLLGGFRATLSAMNGAWFIGGVVLASTMWFLTVSMVVSTFKKAFNVKILKVINVLCGLILVGFGLKLGWTFVERFIL